MAVFLSVAFWGWIWGVGGALLAVPLTVFLVTLLEASTRWRWLADLVRVEEAAHPDRPRRATLSERLRAHASAS